MSLYNIRVWSSFSQDSTALLLVSSRDHAYVDHVQLSWEGGEENEERGLGCVK